MRCFVNKTNTYAGKVLCEVLIQEGHDVAGTVVTTGEAVASKGVQVVDAQDSLSTAVSSDIILFSITEEKDLGECEGLLRGLSERADNFEMEKTFVCISDVLVWATTKPNKEDLPFSEEEYRRRRPHPERKAFHAIERMVMKTKTPNLLTYVVSCGLMYGEGESILHYFFKQGWLNQPLKCPGDGQNYVPLIHVRDAASIVVNVATQKPETRYIFAVDESHTTLFELIERISYRLGVGSVEQIPPNDALLLEDLSLHALQLLQVNLRLEAGIAASFEFEWKCAEGLTQPANLTVAVDEYRQARKIQPLKIAVFGPPGSGKTYYAKKLAEHYSIHHIDIAGVLKEVSQRKDELGDDVRAALKGEYEEEDAPIRGKKDKNMDKDEYNRGSRLPEGLLCSAVQAVLASNRCQNQGFVLDGFPKTVSQAEQLFAGTEGEDEVDEMGDEEEEGVPPPVRPNPSVLSPEFLVVLEARDDFVMDRIMALPEHMTKGTHNTEEGLLRRLKVYRSDMSDDNDHTVISWLEESEALTLTVDVTDPDKYSNEVTVVTEEGEEAPEIDPIFEKMVIFAGRPRNFGPSKQEILAKEKEVAEKIAKKAEKAASEKAERDRTEAEAREERLREAEKRVEEIKKQDRERLEVASLPLRGYLMDSVVPVLTEALVQVCKVRPEDPIDYLAEFLFRHNPSNEDTEA